MEAVGRVLSAGVLAVVAELVQCHHKDGVAEWRPQRFVAQIQKHKAAASAEEVLRMQEGFQVMLVLPPGVRDKVGQLINVTFHQSTRQVEVEAKEDAPQQPDIIVKFDLLLRRKMAVQIMRWLPRL